ncbi:hypothetical protein GYMLUDRAFT_33335 [Collybiopsis luxurians FD-317 M1]|nr:hypothetical protein GYMLUDRAFT_33335 [Collybiopsis luxurians FD-317 M1]
MEDGIIDKIGVVMNGSAMPWVIERNLQELTNNYLEASGGGDLDDDSESEYGFSSYPRRGKNTAQEMQERAENFGFTVDEVNELLCQGVKPWDDDTWDVVHALENL